MTELLLKLFVKDYKNTTDPKVKNRYGMLASFFGLITNFILFLSKIIIGILLNLFSVLTDSVNNLSDFGTNFLSIIGVKATNKPADKDHPFGHQRMDYIMSLIIGCIIIALSCVMLYQGGQDLVSFIRYCVENHAAPTRELNYVMYVVSLCILSASIFVKILQSLLYRNLGIRIDSMQLRALSQDSLNDVISTSCVIIGLVVSWFTTYDIDCFFTIVVAVMVMKSGIGILREAITVLLGQKPDKEIVDQLCKLIYAHQDVLGTHDLMMHYYGNAIYAVIHVEVDGRQDIMTAHSICDGIENEVLEKMGINLTIHMDPILVDDPLTTEFYDALKEITEKENIITHDFRVREEENILHVEFDAVMQKDEGHQEKLLDDVRTRFGQMTDKKVEMKVTFDDADTDYLKGVVKER